MERGLPRAGRARGAHSAARATLAQLLRSLQAESEALATGQSDALAQAVAIKEQALRELAGLDPADRAALREALRAARELNERNARLLAPRIRINAARIETLLGPAGPTALYSASGRTCGAPERAAARGVRA